MPLAAMNMTKLRELKNHKFAARILRDAMDIFREVHNDKPPALDSEDDLEPDEYQFYHLHVGNKIGNLITWCKQIDHSLVFISNYVASETMKKAGINRHAHLAYHIENYIIRVESLYDRVLHLIDAVFHLTNDPMNCTHDVIMSNLKVKRTDIPSALKPLRKLLRDYKFERNTIVHKESYQDKLLRRLELYSLVTENDPGIDEHVAKALPGLRREAAQDVIKAKKKEFSALNDKLAKALSVILDKLERHYDEERQRLHKSTRSASGT